MSLNGKIVFVTGASAGIGAATALAFAAEGARLLLAARRAGKLAEVASRAMRSNISVGLPIDIAVYETDSLKLKLQKRIEESDPYFRMVHTQWGEGLRRVFAELPNPDWT